jgi:hypothetical protein
MTISFPILILVIGMYTILVIALDRFLIRRKNISEDNNDTPVNVLPDSITTLIDEDKNMLTVYQTEWKTIIQTQMHFNDLIIRFRSIVLTAFITLIGASVALNSAEHINKTQALIMLAIVAILWLTAFVMDFGYYHRLLLGSVHQALKFDNSEIGKQYGLFGLTSCISRIVHPPTSKIMVCLFYGIPGAGIVLLWLYVFFMKGDFL